MLRRLRVSRGWSWDQLAGELRDLARQLRFGRIGANSLAGIKRNIARWESGATIPGDQYQVLLAHAYARTPSGSVELGPGSEYRQLLTALAELGVDQPRLDELDRTVGTIATGNGMNLLTFLGGGQLRAQLAEALARRGAIDLPTVHALRAASDAVNQQIGSIPFVRLHLAQSAIVDACRHLLSGDVPELVRPHLRQAASSAYALAARLAFETHDDAAALALYNEAIAAAGDSDPSQRALIRTNQTMVAYYSTGDIGRARGIADAAVKDARRGDSLLMRARAHALQAEMASRSTPPQHRHAQAALHLAWHDLDGDTTDDPLAGVFSHGRLRGFEGICGIYLGEAEAAE